MSLRSIVTPVLIVCATVGAIALGARLLFPPGGGYIVKAEFADTGGLTKNSDVKIGGVPGGKVTDLEITPRDTAIVTMELDKGSFPVGTGAKANSRPVNLLGEKYVELDVGDLRRPLPSGSRIPISRTARPVELDDVLNILEPDVRARLRILINEAGIAMGGRGEDFSRLVENLPPALDSTGEMVRQFGADEGKLRALLEQSDTVLASFARGRRGLQDLVDAADGTLKVTAEKRRQLADTVRATPGALRQLRGSMSELARTATDLEPMAVALRRTAPSLTATLRGLPQFASDAGPALAAAREAAPELRRLGRESRPTVRRLKGTSSELARFARDIDGLVDSLDQGAMQSMLNLMNGWARTIRRSDGLGHVFGLRITVDQQALTNALERYVPPVQKSRRRKAGRKPSLKLPTEPGRPKLALPKPKLQLPKVPALVDGVGKTLDDTLEGVDRALDGLKVPAGRRAPQQSDAGRLLDYLVGP